MSELIERLARAEQEIAAHGGYDEHARTISEAQEALAAAEAERDEAKRLFDIQIAGHRLSAKDATTNLILANAAEARLASLPALLAETRKKALEEAAQIADALAAEAGDACGSRDVDHIMQCAAREDMGREVAAAIRSLSNVEAPK